MKIQQIIIREFEEMMAELREVLAKMTCPLIGEDWLPM